jgi:hypothetical protein
MNDDHASFAARIICLYLDDPDTPDTPSNADWDIARGLAERGISFDTMQLAFRLAFVRRRAPADGKAHPPIRSLAYFRAVALNLTNDELDPFFARYVAQLYDRLRSAQPPAPSENRAQTPDSRGFS